MTWQENSLSSSVEQIGLQQPEETAEYHLMDLANF